MSYPPQPVQPRYRINAKQTAKGLWQLDCTVELGCDSLVESKRDPEDMGDSVELGIGQKLLAVIKETETAFRADGKLMAGDAE